MNQTLNLLACQTKKKWYKNAQSFIVILNETNLK